MAEFVLIHGGMHGSWCWSELEPELAHRGHRTVAPEWPCDDLVAGAAAHARTICEQLDSAGVGDDAIVVAHSMGGLIVPLLPALRPVKAIVLLCALIPVVGMSYVDQHAPRRESQAGMLTADDEGRLILNAVGARRVFYPDVDESTANACIARLKPQSNIARTEISPVLEWPSVPTFSIYTTEDAIVTTEYSVMHASRLGAELIEMNGSHSPFLSQVTALSDILDRIAAGVP